MTREPLYRCDWCGARECRERIWGIGRVGEWCLVKAESGDRHLCENCIGKFGAMFAKRVEKNKAEPPPAPDPADEEARNEYTTREMVEQLVKAVNRNHTRIYDIESWIRKRDNEF